MKVLMFSTDKSIFDNDSESRQRMMDYGFLFEELHIIVYTKGKLSDKIAIAGNVFIYPTNSKFKLFYIWDAYKIGKSLVVGRKLSVISCQDPFETGLAGWLLAKIYRLPLQLQVHTDVFSPYFKAESFKNKIRVLTAEFLLPRATGIRVVSERIKQSIIDKYPRLESKITVLPIYVDAKKIKSGKIKVNLRQKYPDYFPIILMASRLTKEKNIKMAIKAMMAVVKKFPKALLAVVGEGPELQKLKTESKESKVEENVRFEGWKDNLASYYKTADLFLLTSNYEGYGRTVIEAMAAGLPVIMTDVGLAGEVLVDDLDGAVIPVGDEKALADAVLKLVSDKEKTGEFRGNALKLLEKLPSKKDYLESYKKALDVIL